jgi:hypothetical protein
LPEPEIRIAAGFPGWAAYGVDTDWCFELGRKIGLRSVAPQIRSAGAEISAKEVYSRPKLMYKIRTPHLPAQAAKASKIH